MDCSEWCQQMSARVHYLQCDRIFNYPNHRRMIITKPRHGSATLLLRWPDRDYIGPSWLLASRTVIKVHQCLHRTETRVRPWWCNTVPSNNCREVAAFNETRLYQLGILSQSTADHRLMISPVCCAWPLHLQVLLYCKLIFSECVQVCSSIKSKLSEVLWRLCCEWLMRTREKRQASLFAVRLFCPLLLLPLLFERDLTLLWTLSAKK